MKNMRYLYSLCAFAALLAFTSCQKEEAIEPGIQTADFTAAVYVLDDLNGLANPELTEGTETQAFRVSVTRNAQDAHTLGFILRQLNLNAAQQTAIRGFAEDQAACITENRAKIMERYEELLKRANAVREEQIKAYRAGHITKAQLEERLTALRARLTEHLQSDEQKQIRMRLMLQCRVQLFRNIASVLTEVQRNKFKRWVDSLR